MTKISKPWPVPEAHPRQVPNCDLAVVHGTAACAAFAMPPYAFWTRVMETTKKYPARKAIPDQGILLDACQGKLLSSAARLRRAALFSRSICPFCSRSGRVGGKFGRVDDLYVQPMRKSATGPYAIGLLTEGTSC